MAPVLTSPSAILDIFVVWHPDDSHGETICSELVKHYHSHAFSGLAGGAVEVYPRSAPWTHQGGSPRPIITKQGCTHPIESLDHDRPAEFTVVLPVIGKELIRASQQRDSTWAQYLESLINLHSSSSGSNGARTHAVTLAVLPPKQFDYSQAPLIQRLLEQECVNWSPVSKSNPASHGRLARELNQAIVQLLLSKQPGARISVFISHARQDIPKTDRASIEATGVVAKIANWVSKTKLASFVDIHDIQAGDNWKQTIEDEVQSSSSALLMVRTDNYSCREWTQKEVLGAKRKDLPILCINAVTEGEERGSFLIDHVPTVTYPLSTGATAAEQNHAAIVALNRLIDECLKRALWTHQEVYTVNPAAKEDGDKRSHKAPQPRNKVGFDRAPVHSPELVTLVDFLSEHRSLYTEDKQFWLIHPDPPLLPPEHQVITELCRLVGYEDEGIHIFTPRTFLASGGYLTGTEPFLDGADVRQEIPLRGMRIGLSMALSDDLSRLGLAAEHLEMVVAEISQLILVSGGHVTYAGAIGSDAPDLTTAVLDTVKKYMDQTTLESHKGITTIPPSSGTLFHITTPCTRIRSAKELKRLVNTDEQFASTGRIDVFDADGNLINLKNAKVWRSKRPEKAAKALTCIRQALPNLCDARLVIGGKIRPHSPQHPHGYTGSMPGIIEEALYTVRREQPLLIAAGFGGAAALLAHELNLPGATAPHTEDLDAAQTSPGYGEAIKEIRQSFRRNLIGLNDEDLSRLTSTHRPSELAYLLVKALASSRRSTELAESEEA